jgi:hypothetical protein
VHSQSATKDRAGAGGQEGQNLVGSRWAGDLCYELRRVREPIVVRDLTAIESPLYRFYSEFKESV